MKLKDHLVKIWNKAVGSRVKFSDGTIYQTQADGSIRRLSPLKPWRNKSERRQVIRRRREDQEQARANLAAVMNPPHLKIQTA